MKFSINSKAFLSMVNAVGKIIPAKPVLLIQGSFLINVREGGVIEITASDSENRATIVDVCEAEGVGKFCINARFLTEILATMPDTMVNVVIESDNTATISTKTGEYNTVVDNGDEYPQSDFNEEPLSEFNMPTDKLVTGISEVAFAVGTDDFRPTMMGVCLDVNEDNVTFCATDTRQMARSVQTGFTTGHKAQCVLTSKSIVALNALAPKVETIGVTIYPTAIEFNGNNFTLRSQLIKGNFPDYNRVFPKDNDIQISVSRTDLINVIRRISVCSDQQFCRIKMQFSMGIIDVSAQDVSMGKRAKDSINCDYNGADFIMCFSHKYLINMLKTISTDEVVFNLKNSGKPALIHPSGTDTHLTLLLMPMTWE